MGLLDLPGPVFDVIEGAVADHLPPLWRLGLWAAFGALASIELYRLLSPQRRIAEAVADLRRARSALDRFDGAFGDAMPLMGRMLRAAGRRLMLVAPAAVLASLPALALLVWLDGAYGARFPDPGEAVSVHAQPAPLAAQLRESDDGSAVVEVVVIDEAFQPVVRAAVPKPVSTLYKWNWGNLLVGNPAGYLPPEAPVDRIDIEFPRIQVLKVGPSWLHGWEASFFAMFLAFAVVARWARRVV